MQQSGYQRNKMFVITLVHIGLTLSYHHLLVLILASNDIISSG